MMKQYAPMSPIDFREWYNSHLRGASDTGRDNRTLRRGGQKGEQKLFDWWRVTMGFDAPFCNIDMLLYNFGNPLALAEVKVNDEPYSESNRSALITLARMAKIPAFLFRFNID